jgi:hypothetical protein
MAEPIFCGQCQDRGPCEHCDRGTEIQREERPTTSVNLWGEEQPLPPEHEEGE